MNDFLKRLLKYILFALSIPLLFGVIFQDLTQKILEDSVITNFSTFQVKLQVWLTSSLFSMFAAACTALFFLSLPLITWLFGRLFSLRAVQRKLVDLESFHRVEMRRDPLTHVPNTRAFMEYFDHEMPALVEDHRPIVVILLDLQDFGRMNDVFGEFNCDKFLKKFAPFIEGQLRSNEPAFRISPKDGDSSVFRIHTGGDEFVSIIKGTEVDAMFLLSRLMDEIWHEANLWGELLGIEAFTPRLNVSVYQMVHSLEWLRGLPSNENANQEMARAFPRSADVAQDKLQLLENERAVDLRRLETLRLDDVQSLLSSLFELKRISKNSELGLACGSAMLSESHKSYAELMVMLADQEGDYQFARGKFASSSERLAGFLKA